jgi:hypothetical protein
MLRILGGTLIFAAVTGLVMAPAATTASSPLSSGGGSQREFELRAAVAKLRRGMTEAEVRRQMKAFVVDSGKIYFGGTGHSRLYLALPGNRQLWLDLGGTIDDYKVVIVGRIEPKQAWRRFDGDRIVVADLTFYF